MLRKDDDMKKTIIIILIALVVVVGGVFGYKYISEKEAIKNKNNEVKNDSKVLVVYFSAQGHTDRIAREIASNLNATVFEIEPKNEYTNDDLNYSNKNSRVSKEHDDESLRKVELVSNNVPDFDSYDTVLIGYPIWWGIAAWPVDTFVKNNDFTGKTVIPFCTSASSGLGESGKNLSRLAGTGNWLDGHRFSSSATSENIKEWTDSLSK